MLGKSDPCDLNPESRSNRTPDEVWKFLGDISKIAKWDCGVGSVVEAAKGANGPIGMRFETFAPDGGGTGSRKEGYQIVQAAGDCCTVELISSTGNA
jgi:hypothetical protein